MTVLTVEGLRVFAGKRPVVDGLSFAVEPGESVALVGGEGARLGALAPLRWSGEPDVRVEGRIELDGVARLIAPDGRASLHPFQRVGTQLSAVIRARHQMSPAAAHDRAIDLLELVGVNEPHRRIECRPAALTPGECRRVTIALALAGEPALIVAEEPTATLDLTVQVQVLALLRRLQQRLGFGLLLATRDRGVASELSAEIVPVGEAPPAVPLAFGRREPRRVDDAGITLVPGETLGLLGESRSGVAALAREIAARGGGEVTVVTSRDPRALRELCDRIAVLYLGRIVELAPTEELFTAPRHPYTGALLSAVLTGERPAVPRLLLAGEIPATAPPAGCPLDPRCPKARARCSVDRPALAETSPGHAVACHFPLTPREVATRIALP
jgi:oligopeptide/dipeptide ABC transporter ATP-binding protein